MAKIDLDPATLDDDALALLMAVIHLCGERSWPRWAVRVLTNAPDARARASFKRSLRRAWPNADAETRRALTVVAGALGVDVPEDEEPKKAKRTKRRRTLWSALPWRRSREDHDRQPGRASTGASAEQERAERERELRRLNSAPGVWEPAASLRDAIHPDRR